MSRKQHTEELKAYLEREYTRRIETIKAEARAYVEAIHGEETRKAHEDARRIEADARRRAERSSAAALAAARAQQRARIEEATSASARKVADALQALLVADRKNARAFVKGALARVSKQAGTLGMRDPELHVWEHASTKNAIADLQDVTVQARTRELSVEERLADSLERLQPRIRQEVEDHLG